MTYEIIVAEDGSTDPKSVGQNEATTSDLPHCRYMKRAENVGRAAIRNVLARDARYEWLLFIDSDMTVTNETFLARYLEYAEGDVVDGGVSIGGNPDELRGNLRYLYEKAAEQAHTAEHRSKQPYQHLHTANLMIRRQTMLDCPFDERFRRYGYEDVMLGKQLRQRKAIVRHIDNPLGFCTFEDNPHFMEKTEEGLRTLYAFRHDLKGYSGLLTLVDNIHIGIVKWLLKTVFRLVKYPLRRNLCGSHPKVRLFRIYKLGYYLNLK
jgi:glycosyltransferase involved in cell wall biosynthesis